MIDELTLTFACDESGDPSFSFQKGASHYYVIAMIATSKPEALRGDFLKIQTELQLDRTKEYKFHGLGSTKLQGKIFTEIAKLDFQAWVLMVDKTQLPDTFKFISGLDFYLYFITELISILPAENRSVSTLILDEFGGKKQIPKEIRRVMKARNIEPRFKRCFSRDSKSEPLIQIADMVAGAAAHRDSPKKNEAFEQIERKVTKFIDFPSH